MTLLIKMQKTLVTLSLTLMLKGGRGGGGGTSSYSCGGELIQT